VIASCSIYSMRISSITFTVSDAGLESSPQAYISAWSSFEKAPRKDIGFRPPPRDRAAVAVEADAPPLVGSNNAEVESCGTVAEGAEGMGSDEAVVGW